MKKIMWISASILIVMLAGCNTYSKVYSDSDKSVDFTQYKTFAWLHDNSDTISSLYNNKIIRNNIRNYFGQCMIDRAYQLDRKNPDLPVQLVIHNSDKKLDFSTYPTSYYGPSSLGSDYYSPYDEDYYYYDDKFSYSMDDLKGKNAEYINRCITLNFIDRKNKKLVWRGTSKGDIFIPSEINYDLHAAIHKILDAYPVKPLVKINHKIK